jgi:PAS domain S-box-containing protein
LNEALSGENNLNNPQHCFAADIIRDAATPGEDMFRAIIMTMEEGVILHDGQGCIRFVNPLAERIFGLAAAELTGQSVEDLIRIARIVHEDESPLSSELHPVSVTLRTGAPQFNVIMGVYRPDASLVWISVNSRQVASSEAPGSLLMTFRDITAIRHAEAEKRYLIEMLEASVDFVSMADMQGGLAYHNRAARRMLGLPEDADPGQLQVRDIHPAWAVKQIQETAIPALLKRGVWRGESALMYPDGREIPVSQLLMLHRDAHGKAAQISTIMEDISERKQIEAALLDSHRFLCNIIDAIAEPIFVKDRQHRWIHLNGAACRLIGERRDKLIGKSDFDFFPEHQARLFWAGDEAVFASGEEFNSDEEITNLKGETRIIHTRKTLFINSQGEPILVGVISDKTERHRMAVALRSNRESLAEAQRIGKMGGWELDLESGVLSWSDEIYRIFEIDATQFGASYTAFLDAVHPDDRDAVSRAYIQSLENHMPYEIEHRLLFPDGRIKYLHERCETSYAADGSPLKSLGTVQDITERKRAEMTSLRFGHLLQNSFNEIYIFDAHTLKFLQVSEGARKNLGYSDNELSQLTPLDLEPSFTHEKFVKLISPLRNREQTSLLFETQQRRRDGTSYPVEVRLQLMDTDSPVYVSIIRDITDRKRAEQQTREFYGYLQTIREEEKARIALELHDDLGSALTAIKMETYLLNRELLADVEKAQLIERVNSISKMLFNAIASMRNIIADLRPAILDDLGLMAALKWQAEQFQKRTGIKCWCDFIGDNCNEEMLNGQLSINLFRIFQEAIANVEQHSGASRVDVELRTERHGIVLSICDNGRGMQEEHGLGLASYGIRGMSQRARLLGGRIGFDCPPTGGLRLTVTLPMSSSIS